jgi:hypothetical protein
MEGKLYKSPNGEHYYLTVDGKIFAEIGGHPLKTINQSLSLKNCQAIENGYDVWELAFDYAKKDSDSYTDFNKGHRDGCYMGFFAGFQKALSILGDKKFSEDDVINIAEYVRVASQSSPSVRTKDLFNEYQSLQQTEWDVIVEMEWVQSTSILGNPHQTPKLDENGCLFLKRK